MRKITEQKLRKLLGFVVFVVGMIFALWIVKDSPNAIGLYAAFAPAIAGGFTALMWGNHKEHEHDAKCSAQPPTQPPTQDQP